MEPKGSSGWMSKLLLVAVLVALIGAFFGFGLQHRLNLAALQENRQWLLDLSTAHPVVAPLAYGALYTAIAALTLPVNVPLSLGAGALFGLVEGTLIVSFASALGASLSFLSSRFLFRDSVQRRFGGRLRDIEAGIERDGVFYLLSLRLAPVIPYTLINLLFGLTGISVFRFYWVSQLGMFPATAVFVNAGTQLEKLQSVSGILSPALLGSLLLLAVLPLAARFAVGAMRRARA
jgi:uncharacterized membrane protein YdjX (TVP38/TMEM64 family)